jgi:hypothetical protein
MIKKFSSPKMRNRQFVFTPKIEYQLVAERSEANQNRLQFPTWCPRQELNLHPELRRLVLYPLSYEDIYFILAFLRFLAKLKAHNCEYLLSQQRLINFIYKCVPGGAKPLHSCFKNILPQGLHISF